MCLMGIRLTWVGIFIVECGETIILWDYLKSRISYIGKTANPYWNRTLGAVSIRKTVLPGMAIPMLKIRRPNGRLIFNMEITIRR